MLFRRCPACGRHILTCLFAKHLAAHKDPVVPDDSQEPEPTMPAHPEWEDDDKAVDVLLKNRWTHRIGHEMGHITACLACGHFPDEVLLGNIKDEKGRVHHGLVRNGALPDSALPEDQARVCLAGMVAETILFGQQAEGAERDLQQLEPFVEQIRSRDGESRSSAEVKKDLIESAERVLRENKDLLDAIYEEGLERAEAHGLKRLHQDPIQLLTGEQIRYVFDEIQRRRAQ
jgi:hypothetical protein